LLVNLKLKNQKLDYRFWIIDYRIKSQITNYKLQTTNKFQAPIKKQITKIKF